MSIPIRIHEHGIFTPTFSYYFTLYLPSCYFFGKLVGKYTCSGPMDPMDLSNFWRYLGFTPPPKKKKTKKTYKSSLFGEGDTQFFLYSTSTTILKNLMWNLKRSLWKMSFSFKIDVNCKLPRFLFVDHVAVSNMLYVPSSSLYLGKMTSLTSPGFSSTKWMHGSS